MQKENYLTMESFLVSFKKNLKGGKYLGIHLVATEKIINKKIF